MCVDYIHLHIMSGINIISKEGTVYNLDDSTLDQDNFNRFIKRVSQIKTPDNLIVLDTVSSSVTETIISYILHNSNSQNMSWNDEFIKRFNGDELIDLIWAANHLHLDNLLQLCKDHMTNLANRFQAPLIRKMLSISSNFSQEEEDFVNQDSRWELI